MGEGSRDLREEMRGRREEREMEGMDRRGEREGMDRRGEREDVRRERKNSGDSLEMDDGADLGDSLESGTNMVIQVRGSFLYSLFC